MATINLSITIPDDKVQEVVDALNYTWFPGRETPYAPTEMKQAVEDRLKKQIRQAYLRYKQANVENDIGL